jgi:ketosteroid isomerase-like protein
MPPENLDLVRTITTEWEHGDYSRTDWAHPEIEFVIVDGPSPGSWTGLAGMAQGWGDFLRAWEHEFRCVVEGYRELDSERVLVLQHFGGRGRASGLEITQIATKGATLFQIGGGKVTRLVIYFDRERAPAADRALSEQDTHPSR